MVVSGHAPFGTATPSARTGVGTRVEEPVRNLRVNVRDLTRKPGFVERGGGWVLAQLGLMFAVLAAGPLTPGGGAPGSWRLLAWGLFCAGAGLGIAGVSVLRTNRTIFPRPQAGSSLVTRGIYRWIRHPLYASLMCLSFGWGVFWASWPTVVAGLVLTVFLRWKAAREEHWLGERFPEYAAYASRVRRFIPGIW